MVKVLAVPTASSHPDFVSALFDLLPLSRLPVLGWNSVTIFVLFGFHVGLLWFAHRYELLQFDNVPSGLETRHDCINFCVRTERRSESLSRGGVGGGGDRRRRHHGISLLE